MLLPARMTGVVHVNSKGQLVRRHPTRRERHRSNQRRTVVLAVHSSRRRSDGLGRSGFGQSLLRCVVGHRSLAPRPARLSLSLAGDNRMLLQVNRRLHVRRADEMHERRCDDQTARCRTIPSTCPRLILDDFPRLSASRARCRAWRCSTLIVRFREPMRRNDDASGAITPRWMRQALGRRPTSLRPGLSSLDMLSTPSTARDRAVTICCGVSSPPTSTRPLEHPPFQ